MLVFIQGTSVYSLALLFVFQSIRTEDTYGARIYFVFLCGGNPYCPMGKLGWLCKLFGKPLD
jgi:hypothetical protein